MLKKQLSRLERDRQDWKNAIIAINELARIVGKINDRLQFLEESKLLFKLKKLFERA